MKKIIFLLLLVPTLCFGEFTAEEKTEIAKLFEANREVFDAIRRLSSWQRSTTPDGARAAQNVAETALGNFNGGKYQLDRSISWFADANIDGGLDLIQVPRDEALTNAFGTLDSAISNFQNALTQTEEIIETFCVENEPCPTTAANKFRSAIELLNSFDRSLDYLEPRLMANLVFSQLFTDDPRLQSSTAGPHGFYRGALVTWIANISTYSLRATVDFMKIPALQPESGTRAFRFVQQMDTINVHVSRVVKLLLGIEDGFTKPLVDERVAAGTTDRTREFWQTDVALRLLLSRGGEPPDAFGTDDNGVVSRWHTACIQPELVGRENPDTPEAVAVALDAVEHLCEAWTGTDQMAWFLLTFKWSLNTGRPAQKPPECPDCPPETTCGAGTADDGTGNCVADIQTCGEGTSLVGDSCVADIAECPTRVPVLDVLPDRILARCVEQP